LAEVLIHMLSIFFSVFFQTIKNSDLLAPSEPLDVQG
jgi:hypothetical protein